MVTEDLIAAILVRAEGRFIVQADGADIRELLELAPADLADRNVFRLRRCNSDHAGWRTLLMVSLESEQQLPLAHTWAADTRDRLLEPETSDLYMILSVDGLVDNDGACIEANEQFCRKYVSRMEENVEEFLDRTFLGPVIAKSDGEALIDPFVAALLQTSMLHDWLDSDKQEAWHRTLLSGKTGSDLFEILLSTTPAGGNTP